MSIERFLIAGFTTTLFSLLHRSGSSPRLSADLLPNTYSPQRSRQDQAHRDLISVSLLLMPMFLPSLPTVTSRRVNFSRSLRNRSQLPLTSILLDKFKDLLSRSQVKKPPEPLFSHNSSSIRSRLRISHGSLTFQRVHRYLFHAFCSRLRRLPSCRTILFAHRSLFTLRSAC